MNTPPTAPRDRQSLDRFESALLTELRTRVAEHPAHRTVTATSTRHRHRGRWAAGLAVAAAAATAFVVASPGGPATGPAYAVDQTGDGDVVVTIHRLEDAAGLEAALHEHGIEAEVSFDPSPSDQQPLQQAPDPAPAGAPPGGGAVERSEGKGSGPQLDHQGPVTEAEPAEPGEQPDPAGCGTNGTEPPTLTRDGDDWVLRIPADSPLQDRPVQITTARDGRLLVFYRGDAPGSHCGIASVS